MNDNPNSTQLLTKDDERAICMEMVDAMRDIITDRAQYTAENRMAALNTLRELLDLSPSRFFEEEV
jgi:ATP-dependent protease Clp ATPase subunit